MNNKSVTLIVDASINYALGILCILYSFIAEPIGVPIVESSFYPNILGAVFVTSQRLMVKPTSGVIR
jgi:hypothetical protein